MSAKDKHSSLLVVRSICDEEKPFLMLPSGVNVIKLFSLVADDEAK